jgi:hypothetical protein
LLFTELIREPVNPNQRIANRESGFQPKGVSN